MKSSYSGDIIAWSNEQAMLIQQGDWSQVDIQNVVEEILSVGKSEQRELESRMIVLLTHLLKWQVQSGKRSKSWFNTIKTQRKCIKLRIRKTPSLTVNLHDLEWLHDVWTQAVDLAMKETGIEDFEEEFLWTAENVLSEEWLPQ
jgi:hypothetical protein